ncbi:hypothetical protein ABIB28_000619 [Sphingomonas sp. UYEF23]
MSRHDEFLSFKELHRPPLPPQGQTSAQTRYLTANTTAAQRLRALGPVSRKPTDRYGARNRHFKTQVRAPLANGYLHRLGSRSVSSRRRQEIVP